jgi:putative transcriptional regulator
MMEGKRALVRPELLPRIRGIFARAGYAVSQEPDSRPSTFDFLARRDEELVFVKVIGNVDSFAEPWARELRALAHMLDGRPMVVGEKSSSRGLAAGAIYMRHGIPILSPETLEEWLLGGSPPVAYAAPGGFYVRLDGRRLRDVRTARGISLGQLADAAGVSRRAVAMYEDGMGALVAVAERLEEYLDTALVLPVDPMSARVGEEEQDRRPLADVIRLIQSLGFEVMPLMRAPVNAVSRGDEGTVLTGVATGSAEQLERRARVVAEVAAITETFAAFLVEKRTSRTDIGGMPVVGRDELARIRDPAELVSLIEDRKRRTAQDG